MATTDERLKSWSDFIKAVHAGKRGDYESARAIVERVRGKFGEKAAQSQRWELWRLMRAGEPK